MRPRHWAASTAASALLLRQRQRNRCQLRQSIRSPRTDDGWGLAHGPIGEGTAMAAHRAGDAVYRGYQPEPVPAHLWAMTQREPHRRITDHFHPDVWSREEQHRFEDGLERELKEMR